MRLRSLIPVVLLLGVLSLVGGSTRPALAGQAMQQGKPLRVATKPLEPSSSSGAIVGPVSALTCGTRSLRRLDWKYDWVEGKTVTDQLAAVQVGSADLAMAGISITSEREAVVDFSHPYFNSGLQIMVSTQANRSALGVLTAYLSPALLEILGLALVFLIVMAHLVWLVERGHNPEMPRGICRGSGRLPGGRSARLERWNTVTRANRGRHGGAFLPWCGLRFRLS